MSKTLFHFALIVVVFTTASALVRGEYMDAATIIAGLWMFREEIKEVLGEADE